MKSISSTAPKKPIRSIDEFDRRFLPKHDRLDPRKTPCRLTRLRRFREFLDQYKER